MLLILIILVILYLIKERRKAKKERIKKEKFAQRVFEFRIAIRNMAAKQRKYGNQNSQNQS